MRLKASLQAACIATIAVNGSAMAESSGYSGTISPHMKEILFSGSTLAAPLFKIDGFQLWSVMQAGQQAETVLTSPDGMVIRGEVFGPNGENISKSLIAISPGVAEKQPVSAPSPSPAPSPSSTTSSPAVPNTTQAKLSPSPTTSGVQSVNEADVPQFSTLQEMRNQAENYAAWVPGNNFKPGAPIIYMWADPRCPWCARSFVSMKPYLDRGDIELRIIPTPFLSADSFKLAATMLNGKDPGFEFVKHGEEIINGEPERKFLADNEFDPKVVAALTRNIYWARKNQITSVPFYLFRENNDDQVLAGPIADDKLNSIIQQANIAGTGQQ